MTIKYEDRKNLITLVEGAVSCEELPDGTCKYLDKNENILPSPSIEVIQARRDEMLAETNSVAYSFSRQRDYPSLGDQLDDLYHKGVFSAEMAAKIKKVKDDNPKG